MQSPDRLNKAVSRRFILSASAVLAAPAVAVAQAQPAPDIQQARQQAERNADALAKFSLPRAAEPAFRFEA